MTQTVPTVMTSARTIAATAWATVCAPTRQRPSQTTVSRDLPARVHYGGGVPDDALIAAPSVAGTGRAVGEPHQQVLQG